MSQKSTVSVPGDGSCFYHAVIRGLPLATPSGRSVPTVLATDPEAVRARHLHRAAMIAVHARAGRDEGIMAHLRDLLDTSKENTYATDDQILKQYEALIPDTNTTDTVPTAAWADEPEIRATADLTGHPIVIRKGAGETRIDPEDPERVGSELVLVLKDEHYSLHATATKAAAAAAAAPTAKKPSDATRNTNSTIESAWAAIDRYDREHSQPPASARDLRRRDVDAHNLAREIAALLRDHPESESRVSRRLRKTPDLARRVRNAVRPRVDPVAVSLSGVSVAACLSLWSVWTALTGGG